ncbi:MAG TPA: cyclic 2,3-diphosphoglycerate synthetase [Actinomycetota bacterium]|nr:cyclic 2,3-diphosphoglycerate synthetase [Actinomycetota bacterium]
MRALALVDGEHYPPTTRWGLDVAADRGYEVVAALFIGGSEKLAAGGRVDLGNVPVDTVKGDVGAALAEAIARHQPVAIVDLSDEPILGYRERMLVAARALVAGVRYVGADFVLEPPIEGPPLSLPTLSVIGTGKRTGKTAIAGEAARVASVAGLRPVVVAMGRGGPPEPQMAKAGTVGLDHLVDLVRRGEHAASDYLEDAVTTGVTTIGARRCGGGLAGRPFVSNVRQAAEMAVGTGAGLVLLEGSGASIPPIPWDAGVLVCSAATPEEYLAGYLGPYRLLLSDLVVLTMGGGPDVGPEDLTRLTSHVHRLKPDARIVVTDFRPVPLGDVRGRKVYFATTAPQAVGSALASHLEDVFGCAVVGRTHRLADRAALAEDLEGAPPFEVLVTELKAAAVDVAADRAVARGAEVVFADNRAVTLEGDGELSDLLLETARLAVERAEDR